MSTSDRFPLAAKKIYKGKVGDIASPFLSGTRLAFEWNQGVLEPLVRSFMDSKITAEEPKAEDLPELPPDHYKQPTRDDKRPVGTHTRGDMLACYLPASLNTREVYGIKFFVGKVRWQAKQIADEYSLPEEEVLEALIVKIFWHEVGHAWIEDIASELDPELEAYKRVRDGIGRYIFHEEAVCNTIALRMLRLYLREPKDTPLIHAMKEFMTKQGEGYRDFEDLNPWETQKETRKKEAPQEEATETRSHQKLEQQIEDLLADVKVYRFERKRASDAIRRFFTVESDPARWVTHDDLPDNQNVAPFLLNWRHPLHADQIDKDESQRQSVPQFLNDIMKGHDAAGIKKLLEDNPDAVLACDFLGPDATYHYNNKIGDLLPSEVTHLKKLKTCLSRHKLIDCYGNSAEKLKREVRNKLIRLVLSQSKQPPIEI